VGEGVGKWRGIAFCFLNFLGAQKEGCRRRRRSEPETSGKSRSLSQTQENYTKRKGEFDNGGAAAGKKTENAASKRSSSLFPEASIHREKDEGFGNKKVSSTIERVNVRVDQGSDSRCRSSTKRFFTTTLLSVIEKGSS
jgi:hypothetical protein